MEQNGQTEGQINRLKLLKRQRYLDAFVKLLLMVLLGGVVHGAAHIPHHVLTLPLASATAA